MSTHNTDSQRRKRSTAMSDMPSALIRRHLASRHLSVSRSRAEAKQHSCFTAVTASYYPQRISCDSALTNTVPATNRTRHVLVKVATTPTRCLCSQFTVGMSPHRWRGTRVTGADVPCTHCLAQVPLTRACFFFLLFLILPNVSFLLFFKQLT